MYIKDGICFAGDDKPIIKAIDVRPLDERVIMVLFSTGEVAKYDTTVLTGSAFRALDNEDVFMSPSIERGIITWDNGNLDIAPETVYFDGIKCDPSEYYIMDGTWTEKVSEELPVLLK